MVCTFAKIIRTNMPIEISAKLYVNFQHNMK